MKLKNPNAPTTEPARVMAIQMEWLDLRHLRSYAPVSERALRDLIHSPVNPLPTVRIKGKIFVRNSVLDEWLERHTIMSLSDPEGSGALASNA